MGSEMMSDWRKVGAISGVLFIVLFIVGIIIQGNAPMPGDDADVIRKFYAAHGDRYILGDFFFALAFVFFFLPFVSCLTAYLAEAEGRPPIWSRLVLVAGAVLTAAGGTSSGLQGAIAYHGAAGFEDGLMQALVAGSYYVWVMVAGFTTALIVFCASVLALRKGVLPAWLSWLGLAYVVAAFVSFFALLSVKPDSGLGILVLVLNVLFAVWVLVVSWLMWSRAPSGLLMVEMELDIQT